MHSPPNLPFVVTYILVRMFLKKNVFADLPILNTESISSPAVVLSDSFSSRNYTPYTPHTTVTTLQIDGAPSALYDRAGQGRRDMNLAPSSTPIKGLATDNIKGIYRLLHSFRSSQVYISDTTSYRTCSTVQAVQSSLMSGSTGQGRSASNITYL